MSRNAPSLLAATALLACGDPVQVANPLSPVTRISVSPAHVEVATDQTSELKAVGLTATGDTAGIPVTWSATGGTIAATSSSGPYQVATYQPGPLPGTYFVIAATVSGAMADTAIVTVTRARVAAVTLSPDAASLLVGAMLQLTATLTDSRGTELVGRTVTWSSSDTTVASVTTSGIVTAKAAGSATVTAASEGKTGSAEISVFTVPVASVTVSPSSATLVVGERQQLTAITKDSAGNTLSGRRVTWSSDNSAVAAVSSAGLVTGKTTGSVSITATSEGKSESAAITVQALPPGTRVGFYVAPNGSPNGDGSSSQPWDFATALRNSTVRPGDTIWVRRGTYQGDFRNYLDGTATEPIVVRQYPGERATIDGSLAVTGSYVVFWGLEIMSSNPIAGSKMGVNNGAPGSRLINLVVHDASMSGIGTWIEAPNSEVYGSILYNNGTNGNLDHGIYVQNSTGSKRIVDNIIFNNSSYGIHAYASPTQAGNLRNITFEGNVAFNNGTIDPTVGARPDLLVGGSGAAAGITFNQNYTYRVDGRMTADIGYNGQVNQDVVFTNNYLVGQLHVAQWVTATVANNTMYNTGHLVTNGGTVSGHVWGGNTFHGNATASAWTYGGTTTTFSVWKALTGFTNPGAYAGTTPTGVKVVVRPNQYEAGRANIIVYNWERRGTVSVDVAGLLRVGDRYEVRTVLDFYGTAVASGTYGGGALQLPMPATSPPAPIGRGSRGPTTGPTFHVFVLLKTS